MREKEREGKVQIPKRSARHTGGRNVSATVYFKNIIALASINVEPLLIAERR